MASQTARRRNVAITNDIRGGSWAIEPTLDGVKTVLAADFDFGVPFMASIVEPVAERVLTDRCHLSGPSRSFGDSVKLPEGTVVPTQPRPYSALTLGNDARSHVHRRLPYESHYRQTKEKSIMNSHNTVTNKAALHAAPNSVPQGNLLSDIAPKTLLRAAQINFAKSTVSRKRLPLRLDLGEYRSPDFRYDTASAEKVQLQLEDVPLNEEGMRWIHEPDAVLFYGVRTLDVPYDDFVARVDISRVGDCFRDVLGINTEVLSRDEAGPSAPAGRAHRSAGPAELHGLSRQGRVGRLQARIHGIRAGRAAQLDENDLQPQLVHICG